MEPETGKRQTESLSLQGGKQTALQCSRQVVPQDSSSKAVKRRRWLIAEEFQALRCILQTRSIVRSARQKPVARSVFLLQQSLKRL